MVASVAVDVDGRGRVMTSVPTRRGTPPEGPESRPAIGPPASYRPAHKAGKSAKSAPGRELARRAPAVPAVWVRPRPRWWPAVLAVLASASLALAGGLRAGPLTAPAPDSAESLLVADAFSPFDHPFHHWGADTPAAMQVGAYTLVRNALGSVTGLAAAREVMLLAALVTVVFTGALARRFGLSLPATVLATVVTAVLPWALAAHRLVAPVNLAVPWLLAVALFATPNARRQLAAAPAALCLAVAVLTAPLVLPVAVATVAVLLAGRDIGVRWSLRTRVAVATALLLLALTTLAVLTGVGLKAPATLAQPAPDIRPNGVDLLVLAAVAVGAAFGMVVRWLRPFSLVVLGSIGVAAIAGTSTTPLALIALPAGAVVLGAAVDAATERSGAGRHVRRLVPVAVRITASVVAVLLVGAGLVFTAPGAAATAAADPDRALAWVQHEVGDAPLIVDDEVWTAAGDPGGLPHSAKNRVIRYREVSRVVTTGATVLIVGQAPSRIAGTASPVNPATQAAWNRSVRLAAFGQTQIRLVVPELATYVEQVVADRRDRRAAAAEVADAPGLTPAPAAAETLASGEVDARLLTVLTSLAGAHQVTLAAVPAVAGDSAPYSLGRQARITAFDGVPVATGTPAAQLLRQWLTAQLPPYQPLISVTGNGLTLRYPAPSPLGLLAR